MVGGGWCQRPPGQMVVTVKVKVSLDLGNNFTYLASKLRESGVSRLASYPSQPASRVEQGKNIFSDSNQCFFSLCLLLNVGRSVHWNAKYISNKGFSDFSQCSTLYCLFNKIDKIFKTDIIFAPRPSSLKDQQFEIIIF